MGIAVGPGLRAGDRDTCATSAWGMPAETSLCCGHMPAPEGFYCWVWDWEAADTAGAGEGAGSAPTSQYLPVRSCSVSPPSFGDNGRDEDLGSARGQAGIEVPIWDTSLHKSQGCFPWGTPREGISSCPSQAGFSQHWQVGFSQSLRGSGGRGQAGKCWVQAAACPCCQPATRPPDPALPGPAGLSRTDRKSLCHFSGR